MYLWVLLFVIFTATTDTESAVVCDGMVFQGLYYDKELLFEGMEKPYNLVIHMPSRLLFFSHTIWNGSKVDFGIIACHVKKKTCRHIPGISGGYAIAHDRINDDIFFGGHNGIYKYNFQRERADFFAERNKSIWGLYVGTYFYYIEYPSQKLYVFNRNRFVKVRSARGMELDNFFTSRHDSMYFSNATGLYKVHKAFKDPIPLKYGSIVRQITEDMYGDIYFCASDGIYVEIMHKHRIKKVADVDDCYGLTFMFIITKNYSRQLVIFSTKDSIYRLLPSKYSQICSESIRKGKRQKIRSYRGLISV